VSEVPGEFHEILEVKGFQPTKCLQCCSEYIIARSKGIPEEERPEIQDAVTWAPSWQMHQVMGQMAIAGIALPTCMDHLESKEKTAEQRAAEGGIILGGPGRG
jgi:hypothetical protein